MPSPAGGAPIAAVEARAYRVPTERPESDGTLEWDATDLVVVHVEAGGERGMGYGHVAAAGARLVHDILAPSIDGLDAMDIPAAWEAMRRETRNAGHPGLVRAATGVVDVALWDLKGRLLDVSVSTLLGSRRDRCPVYASGGFTSYSVSELQEQLSGWVESGIPRVKMKVGREPDRDLARVEAARDAIGPEAELFVDANGAWDPATAIDRAHRFAEHDVSWLEEPVSSDDPTGLRRVRDHAPPGMRIAAGEYGWDVVYFRQMCAEAAADVVQPDVIRCGGFTGFLRAAEVCDAFAVPVSAHTVPQLSVHVCCAAPRVLHLEWFHDHNRIDRLLFDGALEPEQGALRPERSRPGVGLELMEGDAESFRVS